MREQYCRNRQYILRAAKKSFVTIDAESDLFVLQIAAKLINNRGQGKKKAENCLSTLTSTTEKYL